MKQNIYLTKQKKTFEQSNKEPISIIATISDEINLFVSNNLWQYLSTNLHRYNSTL